MVHIMTDFGVNTEFEICWILVKLLISLHLDLIAIENVMV